MNGVSPNEYVLHMNTGESVEVSELDPETSPGLTKPAVLALLADVLEWCSFVSRESLEEAKRGHTKALQSEFRSSPVGALLRLKTPFCGLLSSCVSADRKRCTTKRFVRGEPAFPNCWEAPIGDGDPDDVRKAQDLATYMVHSWREGRRVLIVSSALGRDLIPRTSFR